MKKVIAYTIFSAAGVIVIILFITSKNYTQLAFATILYPILAFFAFMLFGNANKNKNLEKLTPIMINPANTVSAPSSALPTQTIVESPKIEVSDVDKRAFLKIVGAAGLSFLVFSLFNKKASSLPFLGKTNPDLTLLKNSDGKSIDPAERQPLDGYQITEIYEDENYNVYYGFTNTEGEWFVMKEDFESSSFRYHKGQSDFSSNWANRSKLTYDYYYKVFGQ